MPDQTVSGMALANLIEDRRRQLGLSYRAVADAGGLKNHNTVYNLATKPLRAWPESGTLEGLAKGLELDIKDVTRAAGEACGYVIQEATLPDDPARRMIITNIGRLDDSEVGAVAAVIDSFLRNRR